MPDCIMPPNCSAKFKDAEADILESVRINKIGGDGGASLRKMKTGLRALAIIQSCCFAENGPHCSAQCREKYKQITEVASGVVGA